MSRPGRLASAAVAVVLLAGCGAATPAESVPALDDHLVRVDEAVAQDDPAAARAALVDLVAETEAALAAGDLEQSQADAILAAADALEAQLGGEAGSSGDSTTAPGPEPEETTTPDPPAPPDEDEADEDEPDEDEADEDEGGPPPGKGPKPDKGPKPGKGPGGD